MGGCLPYNGTCKVGLVVACNYGVKFFLASLKADSSSSMRSRRTRSTQLSRSVARCKRARKAVLVQFDVEAALRRHLAR